MVYIQRCSLRYHVHIGGDTTTLCCCNLHSKAIHAVMLKAAKADGNNTATTWLYNITYKSAAYALDGMLRSYHPEKTRSHQNSEVNLDWAASVLGREITWEPAVS